MEHIKLKRNKHLVILSVNKELPEDLLQKATQAIAEAAPDIKVIMLQADATVLTIEDDELTLF